MTLVVLCVAAFAMIAYAVSGAVGLVFHVFRAGLEDLAPAAQARLYLFAALLPFLASVVLLTAALAPSFGWIADHCTTLGDPHSHPHICADHHVAVWPTVPILALASFLVLRFLLALGQRAYAILLGHLTQRSLEKVSTPGTHPGLRVLPFKEAEAFVIGLLRPTLYATRGLVAGAERAHLGAVMAHEQAHVRRRDPLRRFIAGLGLSFHLPGISRWLDRRLACAQEMAADHLAAEVLGSRVNVARALVALSKARYRVPHTGFAFSGSDVERRVLRLMDSRAQRDWPTLSVLAMAGAVALLAIAASAPAVHHGVEMLLGAVTI